MAILGLNLRVTGYCSQGGRKYMEDAFCIAAQETEDSKDLAYAFFAIYDGHGGREAAVFAKEHLMSNIVNLKNFWSNDDNLVLKAIKDGFINTHLAMWKEVNNWPKTVLGLPSTAGTTASIAFLRRSKLYIGHVGDSRIVLGFNNPDSEVWQAQPLTIDHKPDAPVEKKRIYDSGGLVMKKSGIDRVVWKRPRFGHQGPIRRSTDFDKIPFLAVARSLGDLWSYDYLHGEFVVSPEPDVSVVTLNPEKDRCVIIASDGLWNVISPSEAVLLVQSAEKENENLEMQLGITDPKDTLLNIPSKILVNNALDEWNRLKMRADNTSVITILLDHPNVPKSTLHKEQDFVKLMLEIDALEENRDPLSDSNSENIYQQNMKNCIPEKRSHIDNPYGVFNGEASESHILPSNPLQSLSVLYSSDHSNKINNDDKSSPFPRWSKSASGQTSLSKLASWSRLVRNRRMSEPMSHRTNASTSRSISADVPSHIKLRTHEAVLTSLINQDESDCGEITVCSHKAFNTTDSIRNFSAIRNSVKRKYPDVSYCHTVDCSNQVKCECIVPWKRKPVANKLNLTAFKAINEFRMSHSGRLKF